MIIKSVEDLKKYKDNGGNIFSLDKNYKNLFFADCNREDVYIFLSKELIELLKNYGLNINHTDKEGNTALFEAPTVEIAEGLIESGVNKFAINNKGFNALDFNNNYDPDVLNFFYNQNMYVYNKAAEWSLFVKTINIELIKEMIVNGLDINKIDDRHRNLLFYNSDPICKDKISFLIDLGININHKDGIYENMFLNYDASLMEMLFEKGFSPNGKDKNGDNFLEKINNYYKSYSVNDIDDNEISFLIEKVKIYIKYGCDYSNIKEKSVLISKAISEVEKEKINKIFNNKSKNNLKTVKKRI